MKCVYKLLCSLGFGLGILISVMYVHGLTPESCANWMVLGWGFIGFAIGALISMIANRACGGHGSCHNQ